MPKNISLNDVKKYRNKFLKNNKNTASRNALIKNDLTRLYQRIKARINIRLYM